ncbi:hypothetical protein FXO37_31371 [Capsicum annuum]|nr:hypothetical protein FXO37_31371 [Capsicum annuum]
MGLRKKIAHLSSASLSWLHDKNLPRELWAEAFQCACHIVNRLPPWSGKEKTSFEFLYDQKPNVSHFQVFGSVCHVHIPKSSRTKLDPKTKRCMFIGYDSCRKRWKCMDPKTKRFVTSTDIVFDEVSSWCTTQKSSLENVTLDDYQNESLFPEINAQEIDESPTPAIESPSSENGQQMTRRSLREKRQPNHLKDYQVQLNHCTMTSCFFTGAFDEEPRCYEEAKGCQIWEIAMQEEINSLLKNDTWELVPKP